MNKLAFEGVLLHQNEQIKWGRDFINSSGAYDPSLQGCSYNEKGVNLDAGSNAHLLEAQLKDATGDHHYLLNLKNRQVKELP
jgi:hypothetical protein